MNSQQSPRPRDWFFRVARTMRKCRHCGWRSGFTLARIYLYGLARGLKSVRVCNHCGEYNGEVRDE